MAMLCIKRHRKEAGWTYEGMVDEITLAAFCQEENVPFGDVIKIEATNELFYKYLLVFNIFDLG